MAVSLNSVVGFSSTNLQVKYQSVPISSGGAWIPKACQVKSSFRALKRLINDKRWDFSLLAAEGDRLTTETTEDGSKNAERLQSDDQISDGSLPSLPSNGSPVPLNQGETSTLLPTSQQEKPKRSPLTARERLRAARVLSRYNAESTSKPASKPYLGSKVLDALKESDRGKKKGLPEAPGNMFDDSKRGLPPRGLTFQFPGGSDLFFIVFSFVFISTVMFATTYIVWKVGAIHFNEY